MKAKLESQHSKTEKKNCEHENVDQKLTLKFNSIELKFHALTQIKFSWIANFRQQQRHKKFQCIEMRVKCKLQSNYLCFFFFVFMYIRVTHFPSHAQR